MSTYRVIRVDYWSDPKIAEKFTPEDKMIFLYLLTNSKTTQLGIYTLLEKFIAFETGYSKETITSVLDRLEKHEVIKQDKITKEVAITNALRHNIVSGGKPVTDLLRKEISKVKSDMLLTYIYGKQADFWNKSDRPIDTSVMEIFEEELSKRNLPLSKIIKHNVNDNDNDDSYHDSYHDSSDSVNQAEIELKDKNIPMAEVHKIVDRWNEVAPIKSRKIVGDSSRYKELNTIYKRYGLDAIMEMIDKVGKSGFLQGVIKGYNGNYFKNCSLNWCIQDSKFNDILEGKFDDNKNRKEEKTDGEYQQFIYDDGSRNEEDNRPSPADILRRAIEEAERESEKRNE